MGDTRKPDPVKFCLNCGQRMTRKRFSGRLEDLTAFGRRMYCDDACRMILNARDKENHEHTYNRDKRKVAEDLREH